MAATRRDRDDRVLVRCSRCEHQFRSRPVVKRECSACGNLNQAEFEVLKPEGGEMPPRRDRGSDPGGRQASQGTLVSPEVQALLDQVEITNLQSQMIMAQENLDRMARSRGDHGSSPEADRRLERVMQRVDAILVALEVLLTNYRAHLYEMHRATSSDLDQAVALLRGTRARGRYVL